MWSDFSFAQIQPKVCTLISWLATIFSIHIKFTALAVPKTDFIAYLIGRGEEFSISNQFWTDYMESNDLLLDQVRNIVFQQAEGIRIGEERNIDITCHMEIDNGESISGYQYLHGTNASVGDFHIYGTITCLSFSIRYNFLDNKHQDVNSKTTQFHQCLFLSCNMKQAPLG